MAISVTHQAALSCPQMQPQGPAQSRHENRGRIGNALLCANTTGGTCLQRTGTVVHVRSKDASYVLVPALNKLT